MDKIRLTGYVRIYMRSLTPERELGRIAKTGAVLRRVRRLSPTCISALCTPGDAAKISGAGLPVRIAENGGSSAAVTRSDPRALTPDELAEIRKRVRKGEKIRF